MEALVRKLRPDSINALVLAVNMRFYYDVWWIFFSFLLFLKI
jgi:hypothetical protein